MSCEDLKSELENLHKNLEENENMLRRKFISDYVEGYSNCALVGVLDKNTINGAMADGGSEFDNIQGIQRIIHLMKVKHSKGVFDMKELKAPDNINQDERADDDEKVEAVHEWNIKFRQYVENFVESAFNDVKDGCGTAFIDEYKQIQADFEATHKDVEGEVRLVTAAGGRMKGGDGGWSLWNSGAELAPEVIERNARKRAAAYKYIMWTILLLFLFYVIGGSPAMIQHVLTGFTSIATGQCNNAAHFIFGRFGIQHPFCTVYRDLVNTLFNAFFKQEPQALLTLCVNLSQVLIAPTFAYLTIDIFICTIGQLTPFLSDNEKNLLREDMGRSITTMTMTRNAIVTTLTNLLTTFRSIVSGTHTQPLRIEDAPQPSNSAQRLVAAGGGGRIENQSVHRRNRGPRQARVASASSAAAAPLREAAVAAQEAAARRSANEYVDPYDIANEESNHNGGKKSRRRRRRGRKSRKH